MGGSIPQQFIPGVEKVRYHQFVVVHRYHVFQGFYEALVKGTLAGAPISGVRLVLQDGAFHIVDSSELAFRLCTIGAFREAYKQAKAVVLEPIMNVEVVAPSEFQSRFPLLELFLSNADPARLCDRRSQLSSGCHYR